MADEIKTKRAFHEDIFAEEPEKWSWPISTNSKIPAGNTVSLDTHTSEVRSDSSSSGASEDGFVLQGDSNSQSRGTRKQESTSTSEGNNQDDISSSPLLKARDRLPPSIYDESAQSGNPSGNYEIKDLAFRSSFKKSLPPSSADKSRDNSTAKTEKEKERSQAPEKERSIKDRRSSTNVSSSPRRKDSVDSGSRRSPTNKRSRNSRSRSKSRDKRSSQRSRSHSKSRRASSPRGDRRRSNSRDRQCSRSRDSSRRYPRSRSRDFQRRSRSRSYDRHRRRGRRSTSRDRYRRKRYSRSRSHSRDRSRGSRKPGTISLTPSGTPMTPQMALQQTMAAMSAKAQALTGIALPKYYNPAAVNPLKYAEQVQKRKLLWQTKEKVEEQPKNTVWDKLTFAQDQDGKMTAKFRKLMGIKKEAESSEEAEEKESVLKKQEDLFRDLDQQYEMARVTTHTQRGVGLGYSGQPLYPPVQKQ